MVPRLSLRNMCGLLRKKGLVWSNFNQLFRKGPQATQG
jgi:hypothetical protein